MAHLDRSSNLKEQFGQRALVAIVPGVIGIALGALFISYRSMFMALGFVLVAMGLAAVVYGAIQLGHMKKIPSFPVTCPFCKHKNDFTEQPMSDVRCEGCQRSVPIYDGRVLRVEQVRCGFCNHLNFYSEKSTGLICENCNRIVPIANEGGAQAQSVMQNFTVQDDDRTYDLILSEGGGSHNEDLVSTLQQMLALNRNQVKQMLEEVPVVLLTGIPKKKAELLKAQIEMHHGKADTRVSQ